MTAKNEAGGASANGIYNFVDTPDNGGLPVPLPWLPGGVQHVVNTGPVPELWVNLQQGPGIPT